MSRRPSTLDQHLGIGGSDTQSDAMDQSLEPLELGQVIPGQTGSAASIDSVVSGTVTMSGLTGITIDSVGRFITVVGSFTAGNDGTFQIKTTSGPSTVTYVNASAFAPDANNGSIAWIERSPYTLEDDINHSRTDRRLIKGTVEWHDDIPTYRRPTALAVDVDANLTNIADKTLDAHAWIEDRFQERVPVAIGNTFVTIANPGNLKHADASDVTGIPITDGYDAGNDIASFVGIIDAEIDGVGDGSSLRVTTGPNAGERIVGLTRAGSATSPNTVEIEFFSMSVEDWDLTTLTPYTWELGQPIRINLIYPFRERLDRITAETALRSATITGASGAAASGTLPSPFKPCQVLFSVDGVNFKPELPLTSSAGWLVNDCGCLLVVG